MTREQVDRQLRYLERLREDSYEAESEAEERRMTREYAAIWRSIEPYVNGSRPYTEEA